LLGNETQELSHVLHSSCRAGPRHRPGVRRPRAHAVRGPKIYFIQQGVYRNTGFLGVYIVKFTKRPEILTR